MGEKKNRDKLTAVECILVLSARVIRNLKTGATVIGILEQVDVGALVKAVVRRIGVRWAVEVVKITVTA